MQVISLIKKQILSTIDERIEQAKKTDVVGQVAALRAAKDKLMGEGEKENTSIFSKIINTVKGALGLTDEQVKTATTTAATVSSADTTTTTSGNPDLDKEDATKESKTVYNLKPSDMIPTADNDFIDAYDYIAKKQQEASFDRKSTAETTALKNQEASFDRSQGLSPVIQSQSEPVTPTLYGASSALGIADTSTARPLPVSAPQVVGGSAVDQFSGAGMLSSSGSTLPLVTSVEGNQAKQQLADIQAQAAQNVLDVVKNAVTGTQVTAPLVGTTMEVDGNTSRESGIQSAATTSSSSSTPKPQSRAGSTTTPPPVSNDNNNNNDNDNDNDSSPPPKPTPKQAAATATKKAKTITANLSPTQKTGGAALDSAYGISGLAKGGMPKKKRGLAARK